MDILTKIKGFFGFGEISRDEHEQLLGENADSKLLPSDLLKELCIKTNTVMYWDNIDQQVKFKVLVPQLSKSTARIILEMEDVCFSEGQGPDNTELLSLIADAFPELKKEFSYLRWPEQRNKAKPAFLKRQSD